MGELHEVDDLYFSALFDAAGDLFPISDEKYAYELHLQEALVSSAIASVAAIAAAAAPPICKLPSIIEVKKERGEPSNPIAAEIILMPTTTTNAVVEKSIDLGESSNPIAAAEDQLMVCCKICMDSSPLEDMFENKNCPHVFCRECLGRYIGTKIRENISNVTCPEAGCKGTLDPEDCQKIVPREVFERWGRALCEAMVLASQKFCYCPFKDCSVLLDDDVGGMVSQSECPSCRRLFCAICKVAWHSGVSCDEFQGLGADERSREDILLMEVANNNKWRRCSRCRFFVEKKDGCNHVTCRCGIEFCYGCGVLWSGSHTCGN